MPPRFLASDVDPAHGLARLGAEEAHHLTRVLRLGPGAEVGVFDGRGAEWRATVATANAREVQLRLTTAVAPAPEWPVPVTLGMAVLKGDKMDGVVRDAVMLGVHAFRPFVSARAETSLAALGRASRVERWRRVAVASTKQCGRAVVPVVHDVVSFERLLSDTDAADGLAATNGPDGSATGANGVARFLLVEPSADGAGVVTVGHLSGAGPPRSALLLVGPEGGWTSGEVETALRSGCTALRLGGTTLRADAVPLVALTALGVAWGGL